MDLDFADDTAVLAEDNDTLQRMKERLSQKSGNFGLRIDPVKSKGMHVGNMSPRYGILWERIA